MICDIVNGLLNLPTFCLMVFFSYSHPIKISYACTVDGFSVSDVNFRIECSGLL